jgi:hypothetical protein
MVHLQSPISSTGENIEHKYASPYNTMGIAIEKKTASSQPLHWLYTSRNLYLLHMTGEQEWMLLDLAWVAVGMAWVLAMMVTWEVECGFVPWNSSRNLSTRAPTTPPF